MLPFAAHFRVAPSIIVLGDLGPLTLVSPPGSSHSFRGSDGGFRRSQTTALGHVGGCRSCSGGSHRFLLWAAHAQHPVALGGSAGAICGWEAPWFSSPSECLAEVPAPRPGFPPLSFPVTFFKLFLKGVAIVLKTL